MGAMNKMGGGIGMDNMDRMGPGMDRAGLGMDRIGSNMSSGMTSNIDRMGAGMEWMGQSAERMGGGGGMDRMGTGMGGGFDKSTDMDRNRFSGNYGGSMGSAAGNINSRRICQIFVRNVSILSIFKNVESNNGKEACFSCVTWSDWKVIKCFKSGEG